MNKVIIGQGNVGGGLAADHRHERRRSCLYRFAIPGEL
jgi:hypothetical protein